MNTQPFAGRFNRLIGLAPTGPNCQQQNISTDDITQADSGLYCTDIDSLNLDLTEAADDCSPDSLWQILYASRVNALITMETDLLAAFDSFNTTRLQPFRGLIGQEQGTGYVKGLVDGQLVQTTIQTRVLPGASLTLLKIGLLVSADVDVQVNVPGLATPITVVCSANTASYTTLPSPVIIPLNGQILTFSYVVQAFRPRNNTLNCGCGGQQDRINQFLSGLVDAPANGLLLGAEAGCNKLQSVFDSYEDGEAPSRVLAQTLRLLTLANTIQRIITSGTIQRFTLMESDQLYGKRASYMKDYADRINWLAGPKGVDISTTCCYTRTDTTRLHKRGILS